MKRYLFAAIVVGIFVVRVFFSGSQTKGIGSALTRFSETKPDRRVEESVLPIHATPATPSSDADKKLLEKVFLQEVGDLIRADQPDTARTKLQEALEKEPENPAILREMGFLYSQVYRDSERAITYLEKSVLLDSTNGAAYFELVELYRKGTSNERGVQFLKAAVASHPESPQAKIALGDYYVQKGDRRAALAHFESAAHEEKDPEAKADFYFSLGSLYVESGDKGKSLESWEEASKIQRDYYQKRNTPLQRDRLVAIELERAGLYLKNGDTERAHEILVATREISPDDPRVFGLSESVEKARRQSH